MGVFLSENDRDTCVHAKAKGRGQKTFTLVEQDFSSPKTICFWIMENIESAPEEKLREALESAVAMRAFQGRKAAD